MHVRGWASDKAPVISMKFIYLLVFIAFISSACQRDALEEVGHFAHKSEKVTGTYRSIDGVYTFLNDLKDTNPVNLTLFQLTTKSVNNRPLPLVRVKLGPGNPAEKYLFVAGTHGDEAIAVEAMLAAIQYYSRDSVLNRYLDQNVTFDFVPLHNPDGYAENERENANGIDLNRDFPFAVQDRELQPETAALINLVNGQNYAASLFFHSANEPKYENVIRCPVEFRGYGLTALTEPLRSDLQKTGENILALMNKPPADQPWQMSAGLVDAGGIGSDWCVSGFLLSEYADLVSASCRYSHPSLTIELCYPKQPQDPLKIAQEEHEMVKILTTFLKN